MIVINFSTKKFDLKKVRQNIFRHLYIGLSMTDFRSKKFRQRIFLDKKSFEKYIFQESFLDK